jgi:C-terminal processing protease CtpA/Prc
VNSFYSNLTQARSQNAEPWVIELYEALYRDVSTAYRENRGRTGPVPLCGAGMMRLPATARDGRIIAYTKPLLLLIDEFSTSTADSVAAMLQDSERALLFGMRTNGAGGTNTSVAAGAYSEGTAGMTLGLMTRARPVATADYPTSWYIENIGVRPDIEADYMTRENLLEGGRPFVEAFTRAIVERIERTTR